MEPARHPLLDITERVNRWPHRRNVTRPSGLAIVKSSFAAMEFKAPPEFNGFTRTMPPNTRQSDGIRIVNAPSRGSATRLKCSTLG
jgi:hypothetical protein